MKKLNYIDLAFAPTNFFRRTGSDYLRPLLTYAAASIILAFMTFGFNMYLNMESSGLEKYMLVVVLIFSIIFSFVAPFISSGLAHIGLMIFKARGYIKTFKAVTYSQLILIAYSAASILFQGIINIALDFSSLAYLVSLGLVIIIYVAGLIHALTVQTIAISTMHKLTYLKSFIGMLMIPFLLGVAFFIFILFSVFAVTMLA